MRLLFILILFLTSLRAENEGSFIVLPEEKVHEGDYFATGRSIEISGVVKGDVYAFGSQILVDGIVEGDVIATGGTIEINGQVRGNVRVAGGQVGLNGSIGKNVTILGGNVQLSAKASVGGGGAFTAGVVDLSGNIKKNVTITASTARVLGEIAGNLKAYVEQLRIGDDAKVKGNIEYSSKNKAQIDPEAQIDGRIIYHPSEINGILKGDWKHGLLFTSKVTGILMNLLFSFVIGWIVIKMFPRKLKITLETLHKSPWKSLGVGIMVIIFLPLACLLLFITILGFPLALALLALSLLTFYAAKIFPVLWIANHLFPKIGFTPNSLWVLLCGLILFFIVIQIPFIGAFVSLITTLLGLGSVFLGRVGKKKIGVKNLRGRGT